MFDLWSHRQHDNKEGDAVTYAYLRQLSDNHSLAKQQQHILSYSLSHRLTIEKEVMEYSSISHTIEDREKFETFIHGLSEGDCIITQSLWVLSSHIDEVIKIINCMLSHKVDLHITDADILINRETDISSIFPLLNTLNETQREKRSQIGRPKGSRSSSKFDPLQPQIISLLREKMSVSAIARELGVSRSSLKDYIESRELRQIIERSWAEVAQPGKNGSETEKHTLLICPFEKNQHKEITS